MRVSVQTPVSVVALVSTGILAASVASAAQSEAGAVKACPAAGPPPASAEASQGGGAGELREAAQ